MYNSNGRVFFAVALITVLWAPVNLFVKFSTSEISSAALLAFRWVSIAAVLWFLVLRPKFREKVNVKMPTLRDGIFAFIAGFVFLGPGNTLFYLGLERTTSIESTVLNTSGPLWASLLAMFFLEEKVTLYRWLAIFIGVIGSYIIVMGFNAPHFGGETTVGNLIYMLGVLCEAAAMVLTTKVVLRSSGIGATSWLALGVAIWSICVPLFMPSLFPFHYADFGSASLISLIYLILIAGVVCFCSWYKLAEKAPLSLMVICLGIEPIVAAILGNRFLGEPLTHELFVGTFFVLASLLVAAREKSLAQKIKTKDALVTAVAGAKKMSDDQSNQNNCGCNNNPESGVDLTGVLQESGKKSSK